MIQPMIAHRQFHWLFVRFEESHNSRMASPWAKASIPFQRVLDTENLLEESGRKAGMSRFKRAPNCAVTFRALRHKRPGKGSA